MQVRKRDGKIEKFDAKKIKKAILAAFKSVGRKANGEVDEILKQIISSLEKDPTLCNVESIQDLVEQALMSFGCYEVAKSFILYREERAKKRKSRLLILNEFSQIDLTSTLKRIEKKYPSKEYDLEILYNKFLSFKKESMSEKERLNSLVMGAVELTSQEGPKWEYIASMLMMYEFEEIDLSNSLKSQNLKGLYDKIAFLTESKLYGKYILESYTKEDVEYFESKINKEKNDLLTYSSLRMLLDRYVIRTNDNKPIETPQEMFMGIAMHLGMKEVNNRREFVVDLYDILSSLKVTMATPTMSNARKPYHQLSSCFIDTAPDSLEGIYRSITNFAKVSKMGGGMGLYFGKIRAAGSSIRGFKGAAGGVIRWLRLVNDTAVAVDQLGMRQGAVAVYLDCWHKDLPEFLQIRTNNGDDRMKAHDVFPAVCFPDLFWEMARENMDAMWYLMCPHEIMQTKGYSLEDYYGEEWKSKYYDCVKDANISKRALPVKDIVRMILKSQVETGTPFVFNRDSVNALNPNPHKGMIYCSNLCTEIAQNMSAIKQSHKTIKTIDGDDVIVEETIAGDFVVCNLASLVLGNLNVKDDKELEKTIAIVVRALDNVIDLNYYPLSYAYITNKKYRSIGLGVSGYHHMLAKLGIKWESQEHLDFVDSLFEKINYYTIKASMQLAKERGSYEYFEGSDWSNGNYFKKRNYIDEKWTSLSKEVQNSGIRNAYLIAIAPTSSTSIIAGTTAGIDPIMNRYFLEEKKSAIIPRVAPDLSASTFWLYKNAHTIDQAWSIKACGIRQKHIDQAQSVNLYITNDHTMKQVLGMYILAWEKGIKTIYYVRSKSLEVEECDVCSS